jgi:hypothetical protein
LFNQARQYPLPPEFIADEYIGFDINSKKTVDCVLQEGKGDGQASFTTDIRKMKSFLERQRRPREKPNLTFKISREAVLA